MNAVHLPFTLSSALSRIDRSIGHFSDARAKLCFLNSWCLVDFLCRFRQFCFICLLVPVRSFLPMVLFSMQTPPLAASEIAELTSRWLSDVLRPYQSPGSMTGHKVLTGGSRYWLILRCPKGMESGRRRSPV